MNLRGSLIACCFCFIGHLTLSAQSLREVVPIVRPVYSEKAAAFMEKLGDYFIQEDYDTLGVRMKEYPKNKNFGSGFAYTNPDDGRIYVFTNYHVIDQAMTATIEFALEDMSIKAFSNCPIVATDQEKDIALIQLPQGAMVPATLTFASSKPTEGEDVYTAGHPGIGSKPSWQLGKGILSNASLMLDEWNIKGVVLQHTAQVDPGSSGGPLLVKQDGVPRGFVVVGMNTWNIGGRENTHLSIPSGTIVDFFQRYLKAESTVTKQNLQNRVEAFIDVTKDGFQRILPFVAYDYVEQVAPDVFIEKWNDASEAVQKAISTHFLEYYPLAGVRTIIADELRAGLAPKAIQFTSIEQFSETDPVIVNLLIDNKPVASTWVIEQGEWRLSNIASIALLVKPKGLIAGDFGYGSALGVYYDIPFKQQGFYTELTYTGTLYSFMTLTIGGLFGRIYKPPYVDEFGSSAGDYYNSWLGVLCEAGGQLPMRAGPVIVVPYARGVMGVEMGHMDGHFVPGYRLGVEVNYEFKKDEYIGFGLGFRRMKYTNMLGELFSGDEVPDPLNCLQLSLMLTY